MNLNSQKCIAFLAAIIDTFVSTFLENPEYPLASR